MGAIHRFRSNRLLGGTLAGLASLASWYACFARVPRHGANNAGNPLFSPILLGAAFVGGLVLPEQATVVGVMLILPALALSPWTTPRGDDDGLWVLIVPILLGLMLGTFALAHLGGAIRKRLTPPVR